MAKSALTPMTNPTSPSIFSAFIQAAENLVANNPGTEVKQRTTIKSGGFQQTQWSTTRSDGSSFSATSPITATKKK